MSRFLDGEDYGQRRQADFEYGGGVHMPSQIEILLRKNGVVQKEAQETAEATVKLMKIMESETEQRKEQMVRNFVAPLLRGKEKNLVEEVVGKAVSLAMAEVALPQLAATTPGEPKTGAPAAPTKKPGM